MNQRSGSGHGMEHGGLAREKGINQATFQLSRFPAGGKSEKTHYSQSNQNVFIIDVNTSPKEKQGGVKSNTSSILYLPC